MTQLILKSDLEPLQRLILIYLFRSWNIEAKFLDSDTSADVAEEPAAAYNATAAEADTETDTDAGKPYVAFSDSFGMWKDRDIDNLSDPLSHIRGMWKDRNIDAKELRRLAWGYDRRTKYYDTL
jgi:hypothetical protein